MENAVEHLAEAATLKALRSRARSRRGGGRGSGFLGLFAQRRSGAFSLANGEAAVVSNERHVVGVVRRGAGVAVHVGWFDVFS